MTDKPDIVERLRARAKGVPLTIALAEHWERQCNRHVNGQCMSRGCLKRGGYSGSGPVDYALATCEEMETAAILRSTQGAAIMDPVKIAARAIRLEIIQHGELADVRDMAQVVLKAIRYDELRGRLEVAAVTLTEMAAVLRGVNRAGCASICDAEVKRIEAALTPEASD